MYKKKVQELESEIFNKIKEICSNIINEEQEIIFNSPFIIWITDDYMGDVAQVQYIAKSILPDATIIADSSFDAGLEFNLEQLDIYELSHIFDTLESGGYTVEEI